MKKVKGQQHSKSLLIGSCLLLGSTNWTSNSRSNHEMSLAVELDDRGVARYDALVGEMRSRSMTEVDLASAKAYNPARSVSPRARSAEAARSRPMPSGREEPEQTDLQMVPPRPQSLRDYPALGAAGSKDADWSEIASGSDPEAEDTLGALPSSAPVRDVENKLRYKKRVVVCGNRPHTEAKCQYTHQAPKQYARDVDLMDLA